MPRLATTWLAVLISVAPAAAQAPKKANPQQAAEAARALEKFGCKLHYDTKSPGSPLDLVWFPEKTTDADIARLVVQAARLPGLKAIDLGETKVTDAGLKELTRVPTLESVYLDNTAVTDAGLKNLAGIDRLAWLDLGGTKVTAKGAETLAQFKALHHLFLGSADFGAAEFGKIATLTRLRSLEVGKLPDPALRDLERLTDLRDLRMGRPSTLEPLSKLAQLESLRLSAGLAYLTADGWKTIAGLEKLKTLGVGGFAPDDWKAYRAWNKKRKAVPLPAAAAALGDLRGLKTLDLTGLPIGDDALKTVAKLVGLEELNLCCTLVTFEDAKGLDGLAKLETLNARNCNVTDKGLRALESLKGLKVLYLYDNAVTESGVRRLQNALPRCSIYWKYSKDKGDHYFRIPGGYGG